MTTRGRASHAPVWSGSSCSCFALSGSFHSQKSGHVAKVAPSGGVVDTPNELHRFRISDTHTPTTHCERGFQIGEHTPAIVQLPEALCGGIEHCPPLHRRR